MRIRYQSRHGVKSAAIPQMLGHDLSKWVDGQERDVPDDLEVPVSVYRPRPGTNEMRRQTLTAKAVDAILMGGPDFVDATTGVNPDFVCKACGRETLDEHYPVQQPSGKVDRVPYADENGARLCGRDYLLAQPPDSPAWTYHRMVEHSTAYDEAMEELEARKKAESDVAKTEAAPAPQPRASSRVLAPALDPSTAVISEA